MKRSVSQIHKVAGFTLIEIIVVLAISAIVVTSGLVAFFRFRDRQVSKGDADQVVEFLRLNQRRALAGEKPSECAGQQFEGYKVVVNEAEKRMTASAVCGGLATPEKTLEVTSTLDASQSEWTFEVLNGRTTEGSLWLSYGNVVYKVSISDTGKTDFPVQVDNVGQ